MEKVFTRLNPILRIYAERSRECQKSAAKFRVAQQKEADREAKAQKSFWANIGKSVVVSIARDVLRSFLKKR